MTNRAEELNWAAASFPRPGTIIAGKYVIEAPCGRGGLAIVFSAIHQELDRRVAIKMLLPEWTNDAEVVERFLREGRASTRILSEHVVRVFDVGTLENGAPYLVLEYLEGHNLDEVVSHWGALAAPTAVDWVLQAAEAIAEAHAVGVVHRDLKPANLFLTRRADGSSCVKVIDFGLSKLLDASRVASGGRITLATDVMGSPHYMAPEQLRATRDADGRVDIWALGTVLHELISGQPPFAGHTVPEICASVLTQPPVPLVSPRGPLPPGLEQAVLRCLEKDPNARYATIAEMSAALAPFGSPAARASYDRIARVPFAHAVQPNELTPMPPALPDGASRSSWPEPSDAASDPDLSRWNQAAAPARAVFGSLLVLVGVFAGIFMFMYEDVHQRDHRGRGAAGVTAPQGPELPPTLPPPSAPPQPAPPASAEPAVTLVAPPPATVPSSAPARPRAQGPAGVRTPAPVTAAPAPAPRPRRWVREPNPTPAPHPATDAPAADPANNPPPPAMPALPTETPARPPVGDDLFDGRK